MNRRPSINRRSIVKGALGGALGLTLPPFARTAFSQQSPTVVPVSEGFVMLTGAGGNVLVRTASSGQVLVDGGAAEFAAAVADLLTDEERRFAMGKRGRELVERSYSLQAMSEKYLEFYRGLEKK